MIAHLFPGLWGPPASALANHLWQSTLFAALAALLTLALRNNRARTRYWLWFAASAKFLFPFSLLVVLGSHLAWLHPTARPIAAANTGTYFVMEAMGQPFDLAALATPPSVPALSRTARLRAALGGSFLPAALAAIWLAGFLFVLVRWTRRWRKIAVVIRSAPTLSNGREAAALRHMEHAAGLKHSIGLKAIPISIEPGIFGLFRPVLLWPEGISSHLDDAQLEAILAHEVCHARRRDNLTAALHMAVEAIFWFHPLVWWLETRLVAEREAACDEDVLQLCCHARAYAESILTVCEFSIVSPLPCISGVTGADLRRRIAAIVTGRALLRMTWPKKLLLAAVAMCVVAAPVVLGVVKMVPLYGQILRPDGPLPSFEVATIRPMEMTRFVAPPGGGPPGVVHRQEVRISNAPPFSDQVQRTLTAKMLIADAYHLPAFSTAQIVGGPDWTDQTMYQITAKIGGPQYAEMLKMPSGQQEREVRLMEQSLLADRFRLNIHFETRELPVYALEVTKGGPKLTPAETDSIPTGSAAGASQVQPAVMSVTGKGDGFEIKGKGISPAQLILLLQQQPEAGNRLMVDKTGLTAKYDLTLDWTREGTAADAKSETADAAPSFFTAIREQLGLELVETKAPTEVIVIDHIEKPSVDGAEMPPAAKVVLAAMAQEKAPTAPGSVPAPPPSLKFDVVSIRRNISGSREMTRQSAANTDNVTMTNVPLALALFYAWQINDPNFIAGIPDWAWNERYDITAKVDPSNLAAYHTLTDRQRAAMFQALLADRLKLQTHHETKDRPVYALVVAKGGLKIKETQPGESHPNTDKANPNAFQKGSTIFVTGSKRLTGEAASIQELAVSLSTRGFEALDLGRPVIDKTGLTGRYDFVLQLSLPDANAPAANSDDAQQESAASISNALQDQLGLKLQPSTAPTDYLVIDHIDHPSEN